MSCRGVLRSAQGGSQGSLLLDFEINSKCTDRSHFSSVTTFYDAPMPGAWPTADNYRDCWEVNQDGSHSIDPSRSPGAALSQSSSGTLSPLTGLLEDFSLGDQSPRIVQEMFPNEQDHQYNDGALYSLESYCGSHHTQTATLETTLSSAPGFFQDSWRPAGISEQRRPAQINSSLFLTGAGQPIYPRVDLSHFYGHAGTTDSPFNNWQYRNSTPSSSFASPTIETPSSLRPDMPPLLNSPYNRSPNLTDRYPSSLIIPDLEAFSNPSNGHLYNDISIKVQYDQYSNTGSTGPSHPTSAIDDTILPPSYALHPSYATLRSAPSSPYRQSISVEQGTRRHSDSSGSDSQGMASAIPELARFRRDTQDGMCGKNASTGSRGPDQRAASSSQMHLIHKDPLLRDEGFPNAVLKNIIASTATLKAANKRRKKTAVFACNFCPQTLTSQDNLRSKHQCFLQELRNLTLL